MLSPLLWRRGYTPWRWRVRDRGWRRRGYTPWRWVRRMRGRQVYHFRGRRRYAWRQRIYIDRGGHDIDCRGGRLLIDFKGGLPIRLHHIGLREGLLINHRGGLLINHGPMLGATYEASRQSQRETKRSEERNFRAHALYTVVGHKYSPPCRPPLFPKETTPQLERMSFQQTSEGTTQGGPPEVPRRRRLFTSFEAGLVFFPAGLDAIQGSVF